MNIYVEKIVYWIRCVINKSFVTVSLVSLKTSKNNPNEIETIDVSLNHAIIYDNVDQLTKNSEIVIEGTVKDQSCFNIEEGTPYTKSNIQITKVYKGNLKENDTIKIAEMGGTTTLDKMIKNSQDKFGSKSSDLKQKAKSTKVNVVYDKLSPVKSGEKLLIFAVNEKEFFKEEIYALLGTSTQGLFKVNNDEVKRPKSSAFSDEKHSLKMSKKSIDGEIKKSREKNKN